MEQISLDTAFVDHGVPHVAFWNGRVLTAEDMRGEQLANRLAHSRLGRAVGSGVVSGLFVRPSDEVTRVEVSSGLAVDRTGQIVELPVDVELSLVVPPTTVQGDRVFTVCEPLISNSPTGTGLYLLVIRPTSDSRSSVVGVPAIGNGVATECGPKYTVDGVSFRLIGVDPLPLAQAAGHDAGDLSALGSLGSVTAPTTAHNVLAHLFLDSRAWAARFQDPFGQDPAEIDFGALVTLFAGPVLPCEVPVALLTWSFDGVGAVDVWSVRRTPSPEPALSAVQGLGTRRREQLGRAAYCQFQDQLAEIASQLTASQRAAFALHQRFRYLPAAGLVPLARAGRTGFSDNVFDGLVVRGPVPLDSARVGSLLDESFHHGAIDTAAGRVLHVYSVADPGTGDLDHLVFCTSGMDFVDERLAIDAVLPSGKLHLGQRIEIRGRNFGFSTGDARIEFAGINANAVAGSTDASLIVDVPLSLAVDPSGSEVLLEISSNRGADSVPLVVGHPSQQPIGLLHVTWQSVTPATIEVGDRAVVRYLVRSAVVPDVDVELSIGGTASVVEVVSLADADGNPLASPIRMAVNDEVIVDVALQEVPDIDKFTLVLAARVDDIVDDDTRAFLTGEPTPPSDPAITIETLDLDVDPGSVAVLEGSTIRLGNGSIATIEATVRVTEPGTYEVHVNPTSDNPPWLSVLAEPDPDPLGQFGVYPNIPQSEIDDDGMAERRARVSFMREGRNPNPAQVTLMVRRPGIPDATQVTYILEPL